MKLTITLRRAYEADPHGTSAPILAGYLGPQYDPDTEFDMLTVLAAIGVSDTVWLLRATAQDSRVVAAGFALTLADAAMPSLGMASTEREQAQRAVSAGRSWLAGQCPEMHIAMAMNRAAFDSVTKIGRRDRSRAAEVIAYAVNAAYSACTGADNADVAEYAYAAADSFDAVGRSLGAHRRILHSLLS